MKKKGTFIDVNSCHYQWLAKHLYQLSKYFLSFFSPNYYVCTHLTDTVYGIPFNFPPVLSPEPTHLYATVWYPL